MLVHCSRSGVYPGVYALASCGGKGLVKVTEELAALVVGFWLDLLPARLHHPISLREMGV
jgi:hypothetical protein